MGEANGHHDQKHSHDQGPDLEHGAATDLIDDQHAEHGDGGGQQSTHHSDGHRRGLGETDSLPQTGIVEHDDVRAGHLLEQGDADADPYHGFEAEGLAAQIGDLGLRLAFEALGDLLDRRGGVAVAHDFEKHLLGDGLLALHHQITRGFGQREGEREHDDARDGCGHQHPAPSLESGPERHGGAARAKKIGVIDHKGGHDAQGDGHLLEAGEESSA